MLLASNYTSLSFLSSEGFRYFLPAYLSAELYGADQDSNVECVFHLTHGFTEPERYSRKKDIDFHEQSGIGYPNGMSAGRMDGYEGRDSSQLGEIQLV